MSGPWYEESGPTAEYVRMDQYKRHLSRANNPAIGLKPYMIFPVISNAIPDGATGFGSWRGYATFGLDDSKRQMINDGILAKKQQLAAPMIIKFMREWYKMRMHERYKPGSDGYLAAKKDFETVSSKC